MVQQFLIAAATGGHTASFSPGSSMKNDFGIADPGRAHMKRLLATCKRFDETIGNLANRPKEVSNEHGHTWAMAHLARQIDRSTADE
jgi:hypothetical protein